MAYQTVAATDPIPPPSPYHTDDQGDDPPNTPSVLEEVTTPTSPINSLDIAGVDTEEMGSDIDYDDEVMDNDDMPPPPSKKAKRSWAPEWLDDAEEDELETVDVDMGVLLDELKALEALHPPKKTKSTSPRRMKTERRDQVGHGSD